MARKTGKRGAEGSKGEDPARGGAATPKTGYRNPPKHTQFQKGKSGNNRGRPKGSKNLSTLLMEAACDPVTVTIGGKERKITKLHASIMQLATKAAAGDRASIVELLDRVDELERRASAAKSAEFPFSPADLAVLYAIHERMRLCTPLEGDE